jgi:hypothetical protein
MFVTFAHGKFGQDEQTHRGRHAIEGGLQNAVIDAGIGAQRQMRAMLFDCRHRQHRDGALRVKRTKFRPTQVCPAPISSHWDRHSTV